MNYGKPLGFQKPPAALLIKSPPTGHGSFGMSTLIAWAAICEGKRAGPCSKGMEPQNACMRQGEVGARLQLSSLSVFELRHQLNSNTSKGQAICVNIWHLPTVCRQLAWHLPTMCKQRH